MDTLTLPDTRIALAWAHDAFKTHGSHYGNCRRYLVGDQPLEYATEKFKSAFGRQFKTFAYNRCAMVVDAHADRLQVDGFGADNDALAQAAQDLWDDNQMDVREGQVEAEAFGMGDGYVIVEVHPITGDVLIWPQYAENVRIQYSDTMPGEIMQAARRWLGDDKYLYLNLYFPDRIEKYRTTRPQSSDDPTSVSWDSAQWDRYTPDGEMWPVLLNVDDTVPVFHFGNNARVNHYGESELRDVIPLQDAINKTVMDMLVAMEFAAFPQRVILNVDVAEDATADSIQRFQTGIDRMLALTGSSDTKPATIAEFSAAQMTQYLDVAEKFDQFIARVSRVPSRYLTQEATQVSGTSKRMDEAPWVSKIEDRQRAFGAVWAEAMRYGLRLQGIESERGDIRINWQPAAPLSEGEQLDMAEVKERIGWPFAAILREMGYEPDQLEQVITERDTEREAAMVADFGPPLPNDEAQEVIG
jgi:hypothetical protein